jgi:uncharacterized protein (UPF0335 family)
MGAVMGVSDEKPKSKEERMKDLVKSVAALENAIEPFKEQLKDIKKNYVSNGWLSKKEMKTLLKAYRLVKDEEIDIDELQKVYNDISP